MQTQLTPGGCLQRGRPGPQLSQPRWSTQALQARPRRARSACLPVAAAEAGTDAEPELVNKPSLRPPPPRPAKEITRAPPSPRTVQAKERHQDSGDRRGPPNGAGSSGDGQLNRPGPRDRDRGSNGASNGAAPPQRRGPSAPPAVGGRDAPAAGPPAAAGRGPPGRGGGRGAGRAGRGGRSSAYGARGGRGDGRRNSRPQAATGNLTAQNRRASRQARKRDRQARTEVAEREEVIEVGPEGMAVGELAERLAVNAGEVVKTLFMKGVMVQVNQVLDPEALKLVCAEYEVEVLDREEGGLTDMARKRVEFLEDDDIDFLQPRPPVVTVMGHVDHGKTSLLDFIRKAKVAAGEAGGITQAIGAYTCSVPCADGDKAVTFLDTPGHQAFSAMRARGARVTDIAIIICAADDGVQPQTVEAIGHAKAAGVPIVVAINKVDKEGASPDKVKQMLSDAGLFPEEWGGDTPMVQISAKTGLGVDELLETVLLVAEVEELSANPDKVAAGTIIEAHLDKQVGPVATLLVQAGTLRVGDTVCAGCSYGRVRALRDQSGEAREAGPSIAVQMVGLNSVPDAGDTFNVYEDEAEARDAAAEASDAQRLQRLAEQAGGGSVITLSSLHTTDEDVEALQRINIILKGDASGSVEAVKGALQALPQDSVMLRFLLSSPGDISTSDLDLAAASDGMVLGFNLSPSEAVLADAKRRGVLLCTYDVIYDLIDDVRAAMEGQLKSVEERQLLGEAEVKAVFGSGARRVAGCVVNDGVLKRDAVVQVMRGKRVMFDSGVLTSLRRVKDDVKEVPAGTECGVSVAGFSDWREGDVIKAFLVVEQRRSLEDASATSVLELSA